MRLLGPPCQTTTGWVAWNNRHACPQLRSPEPETEVGWGPPLRLQGTALPAAPGQGLGGSQRPWAVASFLQPLPPSSRGFSPPCLLLLTRTQVAGFRGPQIIQQDLILRSSPQSHLQRPFSQVSSLGQVLGLRTWTHIVGPPPGPAVHHVTHSLACQALPGWQGARFRHIRDETSHL